MELSAAYTAAQTWICICVLHRQKWGSKSLSWIYNYTPQKAKYNHMYDCLSFLGDTHLTVSTLTFEPFNFDKIYPVF